MKIYLAGPEVFLPNAHEVFQEQKDICKNYGFIGLSPFDSALENKNLKGLDLARGIYKANSILIKECDIIVANCNGFRGPIVDDGTAWELGYGFALGKQLFGYIEQYLPLNEATSKIIPTQPHESGFLIDHDGFLLNEDFGNAVNLMLEFSIEESGGKLVEGGFLECIQMIKSMS